MRNGKLVNRTVRAVDPLSRAAINAVDISNQTPHLLIISGFSKGNYALGYLLYSDMPRQPGIRDVTPAAVL